MKMFRIAGLIGWLALSGCESSPMAMPPPPAPLAMVASLNGMEIPLDAAKVAPWHEEALCVEAADTLIAKGGWDFQKPISNYWNAQFNSHLPSESERAPRMENGRQRLKAFQPYPDEQSNLYIHIALVSRCERAMKAALAS